MANETAHVESTPQVGYASLPIGASARDLEFILRVNEEQFRVVCPEVEYFKLNRVETKVDDLYRESIGFPVHDGIPKYDGTITGNGIKVPVKFQHGEQKKLLKNYGIEEEHVAIAIFCNRINMGLGIEPKTGDLVRYLDVDYEIQTVKHIDYFAHTQVPLNLIATLMQASLR